MNQKIYKLQNITLNEDKTQFCLSSNIGIQNFSIEEIKELDFSNNSTTILGDISQAYTIENETMIFFGEKNNEDYPKNKLVYYNCIKKEVKFSKTFEKDILSFKIIDDYLFICFEDKLKTFQYKDLDIKEKISIDLDQNYQNIYEVFTTLDENKNIENVCYAYPHDKNIIVKFYNVKDWNNPKEHIIVQNHKIQNIFYIKKLSNLYLIDEFGSNIYEYNIKDFTCKYCYLRGYQTPSKITSITLIHNKYLAINSSNRTIHIYNTDKSKRKSLSLSYIFDVFGNISTVERIMKISYSEIDKTKDGEYFSSYFSEKGAILVGDEENDELYAIAYNGLVYKFQLDFNNNKYKVIKKGKFGERNDEKKISLFDHDEINNIEEKK